MNLIHLAIPLFIVFIAVEWLASIVLSKPCYHFDDFINNISMGIFQQLFSGVEKIMLLTCYHFLQNSTHLHMPFHSLFAWLVLWLLVDLAYYWLHRATHRVNFLWIGHSVHHQSECYNFSVALRQGILQGPCTWFFYLPIALLGFPTWMFLIVWQLNTLYQFFIHTTQIKSLGPLEWILNTPSHHRVHHGQNPQYIDKNYAGSLIIWDKLFGTFEKEQEAVRYGVTEPLTRFNPFYANIKVLIDTWYYTQRQPFVKRIKAYIMPPEWILKLIGEQQYLKLKYPVKAKQSTPTTFYLVANTFLLLTICYLALCYEDLASAVFVSKVITILLALSLGSYLDNTPYYYFYDTLKLCLFITLYYLTHHAIYPFAIVLSLLALVPLDDFNLPLRKNSSNEKHRI